MIILVGSNKGGCGKSTTVMNLAVTFAKDNKEVLIIDADKQSTTSKWSKDREDNKITPYIQVLRKYDNLKSSLEQLKEKYEVILVDVPGRNSMEMLSAMLVADLAICPSECSQADLDTLPELNEQVSRAIELNPNLKVYIYQTRAYTNAKVKDKERKDFIDSVKQYEIFNLLNSVNYLRKIYKDMIPEGKAIVEYNNNDAFDEVKSLFNEIKQIMNMK